MTTTKTIEVQTIGGLSKKTEITTDEFRGEKLGQSIKDGEKLFVETTSHIERADETTITFSFGTIAKNKIKFLIWVKDNFSNEVSEVVFAD